MTGDYITQAGRAWFSRIREVVMKSMAQARLKRTQAVELVAQGMSYDEVATVVGYSHRGSAHRAVFKALAEREVAAVDELRDLELARLDQLQSSVWECATAGDVTAARVVLRIIDLRIRLLGLGHHDGGHGQLTHLVTGPRLREGLAAPG